MDGRLAGCMRWAREGRTDSRSKTWVAPESARMGEGVIAHRRAGGEGSSLNESARTCGDSTSHRHHPITPLIPHTSFPAVHHPYWPYPSTPLPLLSPTSKTLPSPPTSLVLSAPLPTPPSLMPYAADTSKSAASLQNSFSATHPNPYPSP